MVRYVKLVVSLPHEAAEQLTDLVRQQRSTIDGFVADTVEAWLEQRRKDARLGRKKHALSEVRAASPEGQKGD